MQTQLIKISDTLTPELRRMYQVVRNKTPLHRAIGDGLVSLSKRSFRDPALRESPWPSKSDGSPSTLRQSGTLAKSIRITQASARGVTVGSDRPYAAIHQQGGQTRPHVILPKRGKALKFGNVIVRKVNHPGSKIPRRPFLPFSKRGRPSKRAVRMINQVVRAKLFKQRQS